MRATDIFCIMCIPVLLVSHVYSQGGEEHFPDNGYEIYEDEEFVLADPQTRPATYRPRPLQFFIHDSRTESPRPYQPQPQPPRTKVRINTRPSNRFKLQFPRRPSQQINRPNVDDEPMHVSIPILTPEEIPPTVPIPGQIYPDVTEFTTTLAPLPRTTPRRRLMKTPRPSRVQNEENFRKQAESAKYSFSSDVQDSINDNQQHREETRDGGKVTGKYSYSDGYVRRTVHYVADRNGYRVVNQEVEELGIGPQLNPVGTAQIATNVEGQRFQYAIRGERPPINRQKKILAQ